MTETEIQNIFKQCTHFFNHHTPVKLKDKLKQLTEDVSLDEYSDAYGNGKLIEDFEAEVAKVLNKPKSVFMPSGTMAQVIALRIWCDRNNNSTIGLHPTSHLENHEEKSYAHLHELKGNLLGEAYRVLSLNDLKKSSEKPGAVIIELPQRESGGILPEWNELKAMSDWCKENQVFFHLDGARLWESGPYYQKSYGEICSLFDSVYVSFYKGLGAMGGAVLAGPEDFIKEVKIWQRRQGGNLITMYPYIISARSSFHQGLSKMKAYHDKACEIALVLSTIDKIKIEPAIPHTNMMNIFFEGNLERFEKGSMQVALEDKTWVFRKLQSTANPLIGKYELTVGNAIMNISNEEIYRIIKKIAEY